MPHCCDLQIRDEQKIQSAIETLRSILKAAENGNQAGEDAAVLAVAAPELLAAGKLILAELDARIDAAPSTAKPVFRGIVDLHDAITQATAR